MSVRRWLPVLFSLLLVGPALAQAPSDRLLLRLDGVLYGKGGAKGGGGTEIEDLDQPGTSAGIQSTFGPAIAAEVRIFKMVWIEAGASWYEPDLEVVRSHGTGQPIETYEETVPVDSYSVGIDVRPARWRVGDVLQFSVFARRLWSSWGRPPESAGVVMADSARGFNGGVRADWRMGQGHWLLGMDLSFGSPTPEVSDPATGSVHGVQGADLLFAVGVRWAF